MPKKPRIIIHPRRTADCCDYPGCNQWAPFGFWKSKPGDEVWTCQDHREWGEAQ